MSDNGYEECYSNNSEHTNLVVFYFFLKRKWGPSKKHDWLETGTKSEPGEFYSKRNEEVPETKKQTKEQKLKGTTKQTTIKNFHSDVTVRQHQTKMFSMLKAGRMWATK